METFLRSGEDCIAGAAEVPKTTEYSHHDAERVLFGHSFKNLQPPQLQRIEVLSSLWALGHGLVCSRNLSKRESRRGDYPWRVIGDFRNQ